MIKDGMGSGLRGVALWDTNIGGGNVDVGERPIGGGGVATTPSPLLSLTPRRVPMKEVIGIKQTSRHFDAWRVTFNGQLRGDSRGFDRKGALREAKWFVSRDPANRELDKAIEEVGNNASP